jgi:hypothetical protein
MWRNIEAYNQKVNDSLHRCSARAAAAGPHTWHSVRAHRQVAHMILHVACCAAAQQHAYLWRPSVLHCEVQKRVALVILEVGVLCTQPA